MPLVVIPLIVLLFKAIKRHYDAVADGLRVTPEYRPRRMNHTVVVLVGSVHRGVLEALAYARVAAPEPPRRGVGRLRRGGAGAASSSSGPSSASTSRSRSSTRRTGSSRGRSCASSTSSTPATRTTSSPCVHPRVRRHVTGGATCSTTRARCSSRAGCCSARARSSPRCRTTCAAEPWPQRVGERSRPVVRRRSGACRSGSAERTTRRAALGSRHRR